MIFSDQLWYCNACGKEQHSPPARAPGRYRCCSMKCVREMEWRDTLSILNQPYKPDPRGDK